MKKLMVVAAAAVFSSSLAFAHDDSSSECAAVVKACKSAGFARANQDKPFWKGCMEPLLLGQQVKGVTIGADEVKACRDKKIERMQDELQKLQSVK